MSLELLQKSLDLVNEGDGIDIGKKKIKKKQSARKRMIEDGKRLLKSVDLDREFDLETCEVVRKKKKKTNNRQQGAEHSAKLAKEGISYVDQARNQRPPDLLKRNLKYMKYVEQRRVDDDIMAQITKHHLKSADRRKKLVKEICDRRDGNFHKKQRGSKSIFSEEDFKNASGPMAHVLNRNSNKVELDKFTGKPIGKTKQEAEPIFNDFDDKDVDDFQDEDGTFL
ncbi:hypothetical protein L596_006831 [Steinernema carpocapsae]|uniref:Uncharacterized protein n=1 Tax=Steinernema carpocapsae TaxID=34508 RepID=A0A4U5P6Z0_STECR|nr:hypothetical protein L596_006831 [Steinernema carpocapsae]